MIRLFTIYIPLLFLCYSFLFFYSIRYESTHKGLQFLNQYIRTPRIFLVIIFSLLVLGMLTAPGGLFSAILFLPFLNIPAFWSFLKAYRQKKNIDPSGRRFILAWNGASLCLSLILILLPFLITAIPSNRSKEYAYLSEAKSNEKNIATALIMYSGDHHGNYPDTKGKWLPLNALRKNLVPTYINKPYWEGAVTDPKTKTEYQYSGSNHPPQFMICDPSASQYHLKQLCYSSKLGLIVKGNIPAVRSVR